MNAILLAALVLGAQAASPEWAPIAFTDNESTTFYFVDRADIEPTNNGARAWIYGVTPDVSLKLHFEYDCDEPRFRAVHGSLAPGATPDPDAPTAGVWTPIKAGTPMHHAMRYACAGGKLDLGFGDVAIKAESPEAAGREIIRRRAARSQSR